MKTDALGLLSRRRHLKGVLTACVAVAVSPVHLLADDRLRARRPGLEPEDGMIDHREQVANMFPRSGASTVGDVASVRPVLEAIARQRPV